MKETKLVAERYANTLFNLCLKEKNLEAVEKAFDAFVNEVTKNKRFVDFMESPGIPHQAKEDLLSKILPKDMPLALVLFLKLILAKKRFESLTAIEDAFQKRSEEHRGLRKAELITATALDAAAEKKLTAILEKKLSAQVRLVSKIDPNLIGGFILKLDERVVDASYKTKLKEIKQRLSAVAV